MANDESISDTNSGDESILEERLALGDTGANLDNSRVVTWTILQI